MSAECSEHSGCLWGISESTRLQRKYCTALRCGSVFCILGVYGSVFFILDVYKSVCNCNTRCACTEVHFVKNLR